MGPQFRHSSFPWEFAILVIVALVGFAWTVQRLRADMVRRGDAAPERGLASNGIFELGCLESVPPQDLRLTHSNDRPLRFRGRFCTPQQWKEPANPSLQIRNLATDAIATVVFHGDGERFVTEEVPTKAGTNSVLVEWREAPEADLRMIVLEVEAK